MKMNLIRTVIVLKITLTFLVSGCGYSSLSQPPVRKINSSSLPVELLWQSELDEAVNQHPFITNGTVVVSTSQAIYGLDIETGQRVWKHSTLYQPVPDPIIFIEGKIICGNDAGQFNALDITTGEVIWQRKLGDRTDDYFDVRSLVATDSIVYAASQPTAIEAIDLNTGDPI